MILRGETESGRRSEDFPFAHALVVGGLPSEFLFLQSSNIDRCAPPPELLDAGGRISFDELVRLARKTYPHGRVLVVTDHDLLIRELDSLFACTDRRKGVVVVSSYRLRGSGAALLKSRLSNVIAHELGHLNGSAHCGSPLCLMHAVSSAEEVDARPEVACGRCPSSSSGARRFGRTAAACLAVAASFMIVDRAVTPLLGPRLEIPFT